MIIFLYVDFDDGGHDDDDGPNNLLPFSKLKDEELLGQGLALNDSLQTLLAKCDAIASGSSLQTQAVGTSSKPIAPSATINSSLPNETSLTRPKVTVPAKAMAVSTCQIEEVDDDSAQLARRCSQMSPMSSQSISAETKTGAAAVPVSTTCNALALPDPPAPVRTTRKEQDMIELLSITLCTDLSSPRTTLNPPSSSSAPLTPPPPSHEAEPQAFLNGQGYPSSSQNNSVHQGQISYDSYVVPWAQPQSQPQRQPLPYTSSYSPTSRSTPSSSHQGHHNPSSSIPYPYEISQANHTCQLSTTTYPYQTSQPNHTGQTSTTTYPYQTPQANHFLHVARPMQYINSFGPRGNNTPSMLGDAQVSINRRDVAPRPLQHYNSLGSRGKYTVSIWGGTGECEPKSFTSYTTSEVQFIWFKREYCTINIWKSCGK
ncbi:target of Myb protein 1-like protein [Cinnamomum micranthum f. kanehirae]|uniref:Target of Myb protein 1-like protein n=1 Tax=Cinnamomum micranthum f. kanehirae TaxID=337451 RepID=A0A3S3PJV8_9MAGN|nr:target of Myb protein 1-like protein [Cinnamomum micranthum f. kanehirae]